MALPHGGKPRHKRYRQEFRNLNRLIIGNAGQLVNPNSVRPKAAGHLIAAHVNRRGKIRLIRKEHGRVG